MFVIRLRTLVWAAVIIIAAAALIVFGAIWIYDASDSPGFAVPTNGEPAVKLPILMYHSLTDKASNVNTYTVPQSGFEADLKYLQDNGYTTVLMSEVIDYVDGKGDLPEKPVVLSFDDGFRNNLTIGLPLLEKYNMKAVISVVGSYSEKFAALDDKNPDYAYLDWNDIKALKDSGRIEIDNHSYNMHMLPGTKGNTDSRRGAAQKSNEGKESYKKKLTEDVEKTQDMLREFCGIEPLVFTYPYGELCKTSEITLKELGFRATLSCLEMLNYVSVGNTDSLYCMCRFLRSDKKSAAEILSGAD